MVRERGTLVTGELDPESRARRRARGRGAPRAARDGDRRDGSGPAIGRPGAFSAATSRLAARAAEAFLGRPLDEQAVRRAAAETRVPGRLDVVAERPLVVHDGAHNPPGATALAESLDEVLGDRRPRVAVIGVLEDKDAAGMLEALLGHFDRVVFTRSHNPRSLSPATLVTLAEKLGGPPAETVAEPQATPSSARPAGRRLGAVLATGSIYLIADLVRAEPGARASSL